MAKYTLTAKDKADAKKQHKPISSFFSPASGSTPTPKPAPKRPASPAPATPVAKRQKTQEQGSSSRQLKPTVEQSKRVCVMLHLSKGKQFAILLTVVLVFSSGDRGIR